MQLVRRFCITEHEDIGHNQQLNDEIILIVCFFIYNWCKACKGPDNSPFRGLCRQKNPIILKNANLCISSVEIILNMFKSLIL